MRSAVMLILLASTACSSSGTGNKQVWESLRSDQESKLRVSLYQDTDADGVRDYWDQCQQTPLRVPVNTLGCPLDRDGDGRPDYQESVINTSTDSVAAPILPQAAAQQLFAIQILTGFDSDNSKLSTVIQQELDALVLQVNSDAAIAELEVIGHTDSHGRAAYNETLSLRRAQVVQDYLRSRVRSELPITAIGKGELSPRATNDTETGRAANRRVEIRTLYQH